MADMNLVGEFLQEQLQILVHLQSRLLDNNQSEMAENLRRLCYRSRCFFLFINESNLARFFEQCSNEIQFSCTQLLEWAELIYQVLLTIRGNSLQIELAPFQERFSKLKSLETVDERNIENENPRS